MYNHTELRHNCKRRRVCFHHCWLSALWIGTALAGCTSLVTPWAVVPDPVEVLIVRDGIHTGLILPCSMGMCIEYGYGEWNWYALNKDKWYDVFDTVLWPTQGALARRVYVISDINELISYRGSGTAVMLRVSRRRVDSLCQILDSLYTAGRATEVYNPVTRMHLVKYDRGFWWHNNCADAVAEWLRALGCTVTFDLVRTGLSLR